MSWWWKSEPEEKKAETKPPERNLGGPFDESNVGKPLDTFVQQVHGPGTANVDCNSVRSSGKDASQLSVVEFDSCYYGQVDNRGRSRELKTPVMQPDTDGDSTLQPRPRLERLTTEGVTMDSRRLDVFVHALPAVRPVSFDNGKNKSAGTAAMISPDGLMITNHHVVDGSNGVLQVRMLRPDGTEEVRNARVVKVNPKQDLALLQVDRANGETFAALPLSKSTSWREREPLVEMGNANGEGQISMAKTRYGRMLSQRDIPFNQQPPYVLPDRTIYEMEATVPHGYSGGVVLSVPGSERTGDGITRIGTSAIRGITVYSNLDNKSYIVPAARVQFLLDEYRKEQAAKPGK